MNILTLDNRPSFLPILFRCLLIQLFFMFCLLVPADRVEAADAYGISIAGTTRTVDDGENISATATGVDRAYGANLDTAATLKTMERFLVQPWTAEAMERISTIIP